LQIRLSDFGHRIYPTSTPDSSKFFLDMFGLSAKNLKLDQNHPFWFISYTYLDLCDHVKILSQVIANCWKKVKQPSHSEVNQDHVILSFSPALSTCSYPLIFLFEGVAQKCLEEKISHDYSSKNSFLKNSHPFVGYTMYWIFIPWFSSL
jgi:hypothetical protein